MASETQSRAFQLRRLIDEVLAAHPELPRPPGWPERGAAFDEAALRALLAALNARAGVPATITEPDPACAACGARLHLHRASGRGVERRRDCPGRRGSVFRRRAADMPRLGVAPDPRVPLGAYLEAGAGAAAPVEVLGGVLSDTDGSVEVLYRAADGHIASRNPGAFARRFRRVASPQTVGSTA